MTFLDRVAADPDAPAVDDLTRRRTRGELLDREPHHRRGVRVPPGPGDELEADLLLFARRQLAGFKVPRSVDFEAELPRHPTGKLYTRLLRDPYRADRVNAV